MTSKWGSVGQTNAVCQIADANKVNSKQTSPSAFHESGVNQNCTIFKRTTVTVPFLLIHWLNYHLNVQICASIFRRKKRVILQHWSFSRPASQAAAGPKIDSVAEYSTGCGNSAVHVEPGEAFLSLHCAGLPLFHSSAQSQSNTTRYLRRREAGASYPPLLPCRHLASAVVGTFTPLTPTLFKKSSVFEKVSRNYQ